MKSSSNALVDAVLGRVEDRISLVTDPSDPLALVLAGIGVPAGADPFQAVDDLLRRDPAAARRLGDALSSALARAAGQGAGRLMLALAVVQVASGDAKGARDLLLEASAMLPAADPASARAAVRLATVEVTLGNRSAARAVLARAAARLPQLDPELLREAASAQAAAGDELAASALHELARAREARAGAAAAVGRPGAGRLELLGRLVGVLNSGAAGTAEPLWAILRAILDESGADRGCLMLYRGSQLEFELGLTRAGQTLGPGDFAWSTTIVEKALEASKCVVVSDLSASLSWATATSAQELGLRAAACVPLRVERKRVGAAQAVNLTAIRGIAGVLYVDSRTPGSFAADDAAFLEVLADCAVLALRAKLTSAALAEASAPEPPLPGKRGATGQRARARTVAVDPREMEPRPGFDGILTRDPGFLSVLALSERVAVTDASALIRGESGSGKELVARAIHRLSNRRGGPFVAVDCGAIPDTLVSRELFGHEKGAFTGADTAEPGLFERAHGGTLFLDEVGEMSPAMQAALLRAVQEGEVRRLGGDRPRPIDVRMVAATHRDLRAMTERGEFRQDLLFRLAVVELRLPPLRERAADVALLATHLLKKLNPKGALQLDPDALSRLEEHPWPGNVRELENVIQAAALLASGPTVGLPEVDQVLDGVPRPPRSPDGEESGGAPLTGTIEAIERRAIRERLEQFAWNQVQTAKSLGIDRNTLHRKIVRYGIVRGGA